MWNKEADFRSAEVKLSEAAALFLQGGFYFVTLCFSEQKHCVHIRSDVFIPDLAQRGSEWYLISVDVRRLSAHIAGRHQSVSAPLGSTAVNMEDSNNRDGGSFTAVDIYGPPCLWYDVIVVLLLHMQLTFQLNLSIYTENNTLLNSTGNISYNNVDDGNDNNNINY